MSDDGGGRGGSCVVASGGGLGGEDEEEEEGKGSHNRSADLRPARLISPTRRPTHRTDRRSALPPIPRLYTSREWEEAVFVRSRRRFQQQRQSTARERTDENRRSHWKQRQREAGRNEREREDSFYADSTVNLNKERAAAVTRRKGVLTRSQLFPTFSIIGCGRSASPGATFIGRASGM